MTLFDRMHRVHTRMQRLAPFTIARIRWRFGSNLRAVTLLAWLA
jgi:hypothetical protein